MVVTRGTPALSGCRTLLMPRRAPCPRARGQCQAPWLGPAMPARRGEERGWPQSNSSSFSSTPRCSHRSRHAHPSRTSCCPPRGQSEPLLGGRRPLTPWVRRRWLPTTQRPLTWIKGGGTQAAQVGRAHPRTQRRAARSACRRHPRPPRSAAASTPASREARRCPCQPRCAAPRHTCRPTLRLERPRLSSPSRRAAPVWTHGQGGLARGAHTWTCQPSPGRGLPGRAEAMRGRALVTRRMCEDDVLSMHHAACVTWLYQPAHHPVPTNGHAPTAACRHCHWRTRAHVTFPQCPLTPRIHWLCSQATSNDRQASTIRIFPFSHVRRRRLRSLSGLALAHGLSRHAVSVRPVRCAAGYALQRRGSHASPAALLRRSVPRSALLARARGMKVGPAGRVPRRFSRACGAE